MNVSVVIPTHDRNRYLGNALKSVLAQTCAPLEVLVVDDIGMESTGDIVAGFGDTSDIPIKYVCNINKNGPAGSRNMGVESAQGDVIAFLDDDDMWDEQYLKKSVKVLEAKQADFVLTARINFDENGTCVPGKVPPEKFVYFDWIVSNPGGVGSNTLVKKNSFLAIGGYDEKLKGPEDKDLIIRLVSNGNVYAACSERLVIHSEEDPRRITGEISFHSLKYQLLFYRKYFERLNLKGHAIMGKKIIRLCLKLIRLVKK